jgi:spore germination cell wall hydrolase CwlJ-like protein
MSIKGIIAGLVAGVVLGGSLTAFAYSPVTAYIADLAVYFNGNNINSGTYPVLNYQPAGATYPWIYVPLKEVSNLVHGRISVNNNIVSVDTTARINFTAQDLQDMAKLIRAEELDYMENNNNNPLPYEAKICIGTVIINRVLNNQFPDTINGVIIQPGQWQSINNITPTQNDIEAAYVALHGTTLDNAIYYYYGELSPGHWLLSKQLVKQINNCKFLK